MNILELADQVEAIQCKETAQELLSLVARDGVYENSDLIDFEILGPLFSWINIGADNASIILPLIEKLVQSSRSTKDLLLKSALVDQIVELYCPTPNSDLLLPVCIALVHRHNGMKTKFIQRSRMIERMVEELVTQENSNLFTFLCRLVIDDDKISRSCPSIVFARDSLIDMVEQTRVICLQMKSHPMVFGLVAAVTANSTDMMRIFIADGWLATAIEQIESSDMVYACQFIRNLSFSDELKDIVSEELSSLAGWIQKAVVNAAISGHLFGTISNLSLHNSSRAWQFCEANPSLLFLAEKQLGNFRSETEQVQILQFLRILTKTRPDQTIQFHDSLVQLAKHPNKVIARIADEIDHKMKLL